MEWMILLNYLLSIFAAFNGIWLGLLHMGLAIQNRTTIENMEKARNPVRI